jgi:hypothetical protein
MTEDDKPKRQRKKKQPPEKKRLDEQQIVTMGQIFPGFDTWYKQSYDENGNLLPSARPPGLTPPQKENDDNA